MFDELTDDEFMLLFQAAKTGLAQVPVFLYTNIGPSDALRREEAAYHSLLRKLRDEARSRSDLRREYDDAYPAVLVA